MNVEQPAAPSTPPQASNMVRESIEPEQSAMTPPASVVQGVYATPPRTTPSKTNDQQQVLAPQNSMQHVITINYGDDLRGWCTIHEQVLCCHSEKMKDISTKAEILREAYNKCDHLLDQIESIAMADLSPEQFEEQKLGAKLFTLITNMEKNYPVGDYQKAIQKAIKEVVELQFTNHNLRQSSETPKNMKLFQGLALTKRLRLLNSEGALEVAADLCTRLQWFKATEKQKSKKHVVKAWAQGRLLVRGATEKSVVSLVEWAYHSTLNYEDAGHLYDLWGLATRFKIDALAEECMNRIFNAASASIHSALSNGVSLRHLLGFSDDHNTPDSPVLSDDVVATVFRHVLKDDNPPTKLSNLVIDAMARGMDPELWAQLQGMVNHDTARTLVEVMVAYKEVKAEQDVNDGRSIKRESQQDGHDARTKMSGAH